MLKIVKRISLTSAIAAAVFHGDPSTGRFIFADTYLQYH